MSNVFAKLYGLSDHKMERERHKKATQVLAGVSSAQLDTDLKEVAYNNPISQGELEELSSILKILTLDVVEDALTVEEAAVIFEAAHRGKETWSVSPDSLDYKSLGVDPKILISTWFSILGSRKHGVDVSSQFTPSLQNWLGRRSPRTNLISILTGKVDVIWNDHYKVVSDTPVQHPKYQEACGEAARQLDALFKGLQPDAEMAMVLREVCLNKWSGTSGFSIAGQMNRDVLAQTHWLNPRAIAKGKPVSPIPQGVAFLRGMSAYLAGHLTGTGIKGNPEEFYSLRDSFQQYWATIREAGWSRFLESPYIRGDIPGYQKLQDLGKISQDNGVGVRQIYDLLSLGYDEASSDPKLQAEAWFEITKGELTGCGPAQDQYGVDCAKVGFARYVDRKDLVDSIHPQGIWEFLRGLCMKTANGSMRIEKAIALWDEALALNSERITPSWVKDLANYGQQVCAKPSSKDILDVAARVWYELTLPPDSAHYNGRLGAAYVNKLDDFVGSEIAKESWRVFKKFPRVRGSVTKAKDDNKFVGWLQYLVTDIVTKGYDQEVLQDLKSLIAKDIRKPQFTLLRTHGEKVSLAYDWISLTQLPGTKATFGSLFLPELGGWVGSDAMQEAKNKYVQDGPNPKVSAMMTNDPKIKRTLTPDEFGSLYGLCVAVSKGAMSLSTAVDTFDRILGGSLTPEAIKEVCDWTEILLDEDDTKEEEILNRAVTWFKITGADAVWNHTKTHFRGDLVLWAGEDVENAAWWDYGSPDHTVYREKSSEELTKDYKATFRTKSYLWNPLAVSLGAARKSNPDFYLRDLCCGVYDKKITLEEAKGFWSHRSEGQLLWKREKDQVGIPKRARSSISLATTWYEITKGDADGPYHQELFSWLGPDAAQLGWDKVSPEPYSGLTPYRLNFLQGLCKKLSDVEISRVSAVNRFCSTYDPNYAVEGRDQEVADLGAVPIEDHHLKHDQKLAQFWFQILGDPKVQTLAPGIKRYAKEQLYFWLDQKSVEVGFNQYLDYGYTNPGWPRNALDFGDSVADFAHRKVLSGHLTPGDFLTLYQHSQGRGEAWGKGFLQYASLRAEFSPCCEAVVKWDTLQGPQIKSPEVSYNLEDMAKVFRDVGKSSIRFNNLASVLEAEAPKAKMEQPKDHKFLGPIVDKYLTLTTDSARWVRQLVFNMTTKGDYSSNTLKVLVDGITRNSRDTQGMELVGYAGSREERIQLAYDWLSLFMHPEVTPLVDDSLFTKDLVSWVGQDIATEASIRCIDEGPNPKIKAMSMLEIALPGIDQKSAFLRALCCSLVDGDITLKDARELWHKGSVPKGIDTSGQSNSIEDDRARDLALAWYDITIPEGHLAYPTNSSLGVDLDRWVGTSRAIQAYDTWVELREEELDTVKSTENQESHKLSHNRLTPGQMARIAYLCESVSCKKRLFDTAVHSLDLILHDTLEVEYGPPVVKEGLSQSKVDLATIWWNLFETPHIREITGSCHYLQELRAWLGEQTLETMLDQVGVHEKDPAPRSLSQKVLDTLKDDAREIALRTGVKRVRKAMGALLVNFWTKQSNPRLGSESLEEYDVRLEALKPGVAGFFETEAGQGVLAYVTGFAWTMIHEEIPDGQLRDYGSTVARELRVQGGTDILDGFVTEVMFPMLTSMKALAGALVTNVHLNTKVRVVGGNDHGGTPALTEGTSTSESLEYQDSIGGHSVQRR